MYKALNDEPIEIWGDGSVVRDYIYIGDAIRAMLKVMQHDGEARIFNIGSGRGTSLNVLVQVLEDLLNRAVRRTFLPQRRFDVPVNVLDITRARTVLDWEPLVTLQEGMGRMLANMRRDRSST
jgi:UDP-glucose 4-epimerase